MRKIKGGHCPPFHWNADLIGSSATGIVHAGRSPGFSSAAGVSIQLVFKREWEVSALGFHVPLLAQFPFK
ncbi:hypothetical protein [Coleofasciculus sp. LEGE 07092]|uniref:hypothetical protein n=1 Tax=Coleofasciculus sp. LEGE 07092 TaxID=2777969 RepID=UPI003A100CF3